MLAAAMVEGGRELHVAAARAAAALAQTEGLMATEARNTHVGLWVEGLTRVIADALPATRAEGNVALALGTLQALAACAVAGGFTVAAAARDSCCRCKARGRARGCRARRRS